MEVDDFEKCKDLLNIKVVEINDLKMEYENKDIECKTQSEANNKLMNENEKLKEENKYLIAAKVDLMNKVKCKDSILEEVISNFACDECDFVAGTSKELLELLFLFLFINT